MVASFKTRVKQTLEECAADYLNNFIGKKYVIYSNGFTQNTYYTIDAKKDNYLHLTGVKTNLKPEVFFNKCIDGTLQENDFDLGDKSKKGSIRRKINVLKAAVNILNGNYLINVQETFIKNNVACSIATSDGKCTLGFILEKNLKPCTLLKGDMLDNSKPAELIIERGTDEQTINRIILNTNNLSESEIQRLL